MSTNRHKQPQRHKQPTPQTSKKSDVQSTPHTEQLHPFNPNATSAETILYLQRTIGNQAVTQLFAGQPDKPAIGHAPKPALIQRGEAPVHHGIEETATEGMDPKLVEQMYAGNWMRDFSQFNLPMPHSIVSNFPKDMKNPTGETIGAEGAGDIVTAVLRALAYMEFGAEITDELVTPENIGKYTPEQHVDNPMGTTAADHLVQDSDTNLMRPGIPQTSTVGGPDAPSTVANKDPDRDAQLAGKAIPGLQVENPALFEVSDSGLTKHIYNAIEWVKEEFGTALDEGQSPKGRMHLGAGLHAVEDYFAHSNFIEVALNSEIDRAINTHVLADPEYSQEFLQQAEENRVSPFGAYVDPLYDGISPTGRQAVTTGTAGSEDLKVSMGQIVLPKLPGLANLIDQKIDKALGLVVDSKGESSWEAIQEELKTDDGGLAMLEVVNALDKHIKVPAWDIWMTGRDIPLTDRFIPTGWDTEVTSKGVVSAIKHYIQLYKDIQGRLDEVESAIDTIFFPKAVYDYIAKQVDKLLMQAINDLKQTVRERINEFLLSLAEEIVGSALDKDVDFKKEKKKGVEYALNYVANVGVEHIRESTSIEAQLPEILEKYKDDPEGLYQAYGIVAGTPQFALPPSHSEISKDHAPHEDEHHNPADALGGYDVSEGSLFYQLHRNLAVEADKHIIKKMQEAWDAQTMTNSVEGLETDPTIDPESVTDEARKHQQLEEKRAHKEGRTLRTGADKGPEAQDLMALVDYFIAHPDDTGWWKPIMQDYVNSNEEQVINHIRHRNGTRDRRD